MAEPLISVVVPIHDVEPYLAACLDSVLAQGIDELEVLCIDDGSTDDSGRIADAYAARDPRISVLHQDNAGLAATRTRGAHLATGRYLAFLDSDDLLPADAYARMLASAESSGADIVAGDIRRLTSLGLKPSPTFSPIFTPARDRVHVRDDHHLLQDRIAPNKLFRRRFWAENDLQFPTGRLHEDIPVVLRAHVLANHVNVLDTPVYIWRIRQGADLSITQRRLDPRALTDRIWGVTDVGAFLARQGEHDLKRIYDRLALTDDLRWYARELDRADDDYVRLFVELGGDFLAGVDPDVLDDAPALERIRWELVRRGDGAGLVALARAQHVDPAGPPVRRRALGRLELEPPAGLEGRKLPRKLRRLDDEVTLASGVDAITTDGTDLVVTGWAALSHVDVAEPGDQDLRLLLVDVDGDERIELEHRHVPAPTASGRFDRRGAGFRVTIDAAALGGRWTKGTDRWRLAAEVTVGRTVRHGPVTSPAIGAPRRPPTVDVGRVRVGPRFDRHALDVVVAARPVLVTDIADVDGRIRLTLASRRTLVSVRLRTPGGVTEHLPVVSLGPGGDTPHGDGDGNGDGGAGTVGCLLDPVRLGRLVGLDAERSVALHAVDDKGRTVRLSVDDGLDHLLMAVVGGAVGIEVSRYGYASLRCSPPVLLFDEVVRESTTTDHRRQPTDAVPSGIAITADVIGANARRVEVRLDPRARHDPRRVDVELVGDHRVRLHLDPGQFAHVPGEIGFQARLRAVEPRQPDTELPIRVRRALIAAGPRPVEGGPLTTWFDDRSWQQPIVVVESDLAPDERAPADQARLLARAAATRDRRPVPGLLVIAGAGRTAWGEAAAVAAAVHARDPGLPVHWGVADRSCTPPDWAEVVATGSAAWHERLARASHVVADTALPRGYERARGQRVVRIWSGVPVRTVGGDGPGVRDAEQPADAHAAWSHLVAVGPQAAATLRAAFAWDDEVAVVGAPAHDDLADGERRAARRRAWRDAHGVGADDSVVLHLPTWLDGARHPGGGLRRIDDLDLERFTELLVRRGAELVGAAGRAVRPRVFVRGHPRIVDAPVDDAGHGALTALDAGHDVLDLLLAADVVLAHPSSVVLEAARVGVPVVLHDPAGYALGTQLGAPNVDLVATARPAAVTTTLVEAVGAALEVLGRDPRSGGTDPDGAGSERHLEVVTASAADAVAELLLRP